MDRKTRSSNALVPSEPERIDPSLSDGFRQIYNREISIEIRHNDEAVGHLVTLRIKLLILGLETDPEGFRMELCDDEDIFFHYYHALDPAGFERVQRAQKLRVEFCQYPQMVIELLNLCVKQPHKTMLVLYVFGNGTGRIDFVQNLEFKFVEMLSADVVKTPQALVQQHIIYRYFTMKKRVEVLENQLNAVNNLVRSKNPSLLLQVQRTTRKAEKNTNRSVSKYRGGSSVGSGDASP